MPVSHRPQADDTLLKARKILELERTKKCQDSAVMGGLDKFLAVLLEQNGAAKSSALVEAIRALPGGGYRSLALHDRARWLSEALAALSGRAPPAPKRPPRPREPRVAAPKGVDAPISALKRVGPKNSAQFESAGLRTVRDVLYYFPRRHVDYGNLRPISELTAGEDQTVRVRVWSAKESQLGRSMKGSEATVGDDSGMMHVVWFNNPWIAKQLRTNSEIVLSGRVRMYKNRPTFENPEWEPWESEEQLAHTGRLVPVYSMTGELKSNRTVRALTRRAIDSFASGLADPLPGELRERLGLMDLPDAIRQAHFPDSFDALDAARRRLAIDELLPLQISVLLRRREWQQPGSADALVLPVAMRIAFIASLPFELTGAQQRSLTHLLDDLARDVPMSRLLQGDVGSGKTVVAAAGLLAAAANGHQAALMAPTEILAEQHFRTICALLGANVAAGAARSGQANDASVAEATPPYLGRPLRIALLTGSLKASGKSSLYERIEKGEVDVAIGTHALIQGGVTFARLGFVIVDEQHRFGVMQRAALRDKSARSSHMLVMTATPIPRSLYLTLYGDLDASAIDEMPPGRKPVVTRWWPPERRQDAYDFLQEQVEAGRQAFVICPLVEESESSQSKAAVQEYERLRADVFPQFEIELVHGRMSGKEKDAAMTRFRSGEAQILVSTSVIEVGIDVPNATVMLIEGADRFGLAQLHQFRGRVGRGADQSYCLLLSESPSAEAQQRLRLMQDTTDGFALAEADLRMRGPGEFFGKRQSGLPDFRIASLLDTRLIELARREAEGLLADDPELSRPEHAGLAIEVARMMELVTGEVH